jgi:hypothetical protein
LAIFEKEQRRDIHNVAVDGLGSKKALRAMIRPADILWVKKIKAEHR